VTFRLRHEWRDGPEIGGVRRATCPHCETLRVENPSSSPPVVFMQPGVGATPEEPPCLEPKRRGIRRAGKRDRFGCELGQAARERAVYEAVRQAGPDLPDPEDDGVIRSRS
jgi:hypothetical protein